MAYIYDLTDTWNAGGTTFNAIKMNVTDTASAVSSKLVTLQTSGTEHFSVTKAGVGYFSGNLGVGTTTPSEAVEISRDANPKIRFLDVGNIDAKIGIVGSTALGFEVNGAERMRIDSSGQVGIGTTTPSTNLGAYTGLSIAGSNSGLQLQGSTFSSVLFGDAANVSIGSLVYDHSVDALRTFVNNAERMRIDATGNVGIGATSPGYRLDVSGQARSFATPSTFAQLQSLTQYTGSAAPVALGQGSDSTGFLINIANASLAFGTNNAERMRIDASGNVGIGTSSPAYRLQVQFDAAVFAGSCNILMSAEGGAFGSVGTTTNHSLLFKTNNTERARIDASGNLLVGTTSIGLSNTNSLVLDPGNGYLITNHSGTGSGTAYAFFGYNGTSIGTITQNGTTGVLYNTSSDIRLKENIADADDAASLIDAIQVRKFDWKAGGSHQRYGFVAQELIEVAPEAVSQPANSDEMMGVDYSKLVPMLVKEIQSLRARVAQLEGN